MKVSKRDLILDSIIRAYLIDNSPIGSNELCSRMPIGIPASTIRVYFKKLSDEGAITQFHISGGRIPTAIAMKAYWREHLALDGIFDVRNANVLNLLINEFGIYSIVFENNKQNLNEILNLDNRFLVLNFDKDEIVLKFNAKVEKFLANLVGIDLEQLETIAMQVGLSELKNKISQLRRSKILFLENEKIALDIFEKRSFKKAITPDLERIFGSNLIFLNDEYLGMKLDVNFEGKEAKMLCAGSIYNDYERFLNNLKEAA